MNANADRLHSPQQRDERAARILDVAAELLRRHGYRRVTVDDVAVAAGIGKGTVYLHYRTREDLFAAVAGRETVRAIGELLDALREDPRSSLPHRFARAYFRAIMHRPLLRGFVLADTEVWGKLASPRASTGRRHQLVSRTYFELLAAHGVLREDLDTDAAAYAFLATLEGFLQAETATPTTQAAGVASLEQRAALLADTIHHAFESPRTLPAAAQQALAAVVIGVFTDLTNADRADLGIPQPSPDSETSRG